MSRRALWIVLLAGSALSLAVCYQIATQSLILGSREGRWFYGYIRFFTPRALVVAVGATAICAALLAAPEHFVTRHERLTVLLWIVTGTAVAALVRSLTPYSLGSMFASDGANSFYSVTRRWTAATVLTDFDRVREYWPLHAQSNMPGKLLVVYALRLASRRPDVMAWLVVLLSSLGGAILYVVVRDVLDDRRVALYSLVLYLFVPARLLFLPLLNVVSPVVALASLLLLVRWLKTANAAYAVLFGASLYWLVLFEPLLLVIGLLFAVLLASALRDGAISWRTGLAQGALAVAAFAACHAAVDAIWGFALWHALRVVSAHAVAFNAQQQRPYDIWVTRNLVDFMFGVGICQAAAFPAALVVGLAQGRSMQDRLMRPIALILLSLTVTLLATDLIGVNRGEVIRLWIFLACLFQIPAAYVCARLSRGAVLLMLGMALLQTAIGTAMIGFVVPG